MTAAKDLHKAAVKASYAMRAVFFYKKFKDGNLHALVSQAHNLKIANEKWKWYQDLGISTSAMKRIKKSGVPVAVCFCHPDVIRENPHLILYYRAIACIPQKGVAELAFGISKLEIGQGRELNDLRARQLAKAINEVMSTIIDSDPDFFSANLELLAYTSFGVTIDGSWSNKIGSEAGLQVKDILFTHFYNAGLISNVTLVDGNKAKPNIATLTTAIRDFTLNNGYTIMFSSEPDIGIWDPGNKLIGVVEIKGGLDAAGALERLGAAKKTFDEALNTNSEALTMYLACCITETVKTRIASDRSFKKTVDLTTVFLDDEARKDFIDELRWWVRLPKS